MDRLISELRQDLIKSCGRSEAVDDDHDLDGSEAVDDDHDLDGENTPHPVMTREMLASAVEEAFKRALAIEKDLGHVDGDGDLEAQDTSTRCAASTPVNELGARAATMIREASRRSQRAFFEKAIEPGADVKTIKDTLEALDFRLNLDDFGPVVQKVAPDSPLASLFLDQMTQLLLYASAKRAFAESTKLLAFISMVFNDGSNEAQRHGRAVLAGGLFRDGVGPYEHVASRYRDALDHFIGGASKKRKRSSFESFHKGLFEALAKGPINARLIGVLLDLGAEQLDQRDKQAKRAHFSLFFELLALSLECKAFGAAAEAMRGGERHGFLVILRNEAELKRRRGLLELLMRKGLDESGHALAPVLTALLDCAPELLQPADILKSAFHEDVVTKLFEVYGKLRALPAFLPVVLPHVGLTSLIACASFTDALAVIFAAAPAAQITPIFRIFVKLTPFPGARDAFRHYLLSIAVTEDNAEILKTLIADAYVAIATDLPSLCSSIPLFATLLSLRSLADVYAKDHDNATLQRLCERLAAPPPIEFEFTDLASANGVAQLAEAVLRDTAIAKDEQGVASHCDLSAQNLELLAPSLSPMAIASAIEELLGNEALLGTALSTASFYECDAIRHVFVRALIRRLPLRLDVLMLLPPGYIPPKMLGELQHALDPPDFIRVARLYPGEGTELIIAQLRSSTPRLSELAGLLRALSGSAIAVSGIKKCPYCGAGHACAAHARCIQMASQGDLRECIVDLLASRLESCPVTQAAMACFGYLLEFGAEQPPYSARCLSRLPTFMKAAVSDRALSKEGAMLLRSVCSVHRRFKPGISPSAFSVLVASIFSGMQRSRVSGCDAILVDAVNKLYANAASRQLPMLVDTLCSELEGSTARASVALRCLKTLVPVLTRGDRRICVLKRKAHRLMRALLRICSDSADAACGVDSADVADIINALDCVALLLTRLREVWTSAENAAMIMQGTMSPIVNAGFNKGKDFDPLQYRAAHGVIFSLLKYRSKAIYTCTPPFTAIIRAMQRCVVYTSDFESAVLLSRLCEEFVPHKKVFCHHVIYLLAHYLALRQRPGIQQVVQQPMQLSSFYMLDCLTDGGLQHLHASSTPTARSLLKELVEEHKQSHKYTGKT